MITSIAHAGTGTFADIVSGLTTGLASDIITLIISLALVVFLWGLISYIMNSGNQEKREDSIKYITAGLIGLFVMFAVWGLVAILSSTFGLGFGIPYLQ